MHRDYIEGFDTILMALAPPLQGAVIGLLVGRRRTRPGRAVMGGLIGGTVGAWAGVFCYRFLILPQVTDRLIFDGCVLAGFLLGSILLARRLAGPSVAVAGSIAKDQSSSAGGCALVIAGAGVAGLGYLVHSAGTGASAFMPITNDVKLLAVLAILEGMGLILLVLAGPGSATASRPSPSRTRIMVILAMINLAVLVAGILFSRVEDDARTHDPVADLVVNTQWNVVFALLTVSAVSSAGVYVLLTRWRTRSDA
jgi:hypothetical protein